MESTKWILGIDGGGTKTTAILVAQDGTLGAQEKTGATSLTLLGVDRVVEVVFDLVKQCCAKVSCVPQQLHAVGIGLAGAGRAEDRDEVRRSLVSLGRKNHFPFSKVIVESDWRVALEGAFPTTPGIVLIAGTGSIACAKDENDALHRAGGWGRLLGDEGSAYELGREGLNAVLRAYEGRGGKTLLQQYAFEHFEVASIDELVSKIYRHTTDIASFASKILLAEKQRDHIAHTILFRGAGELVELVRTIIMKIKPKRRMPVALSGGLLEQDNTYSTMVKDRLKNTLPQILLQRPKFSADYGAAILAFHPFTFPQ
jgi:N-acetylglucosamine kinase-like BadF-type ATPase